MTRIAAISRFCLPVLLLFWGSADFLAYAAQIPTVENLDAQIAIQERARKTLNRQIEQYNETAKKKGQEAQGLLGRITKLRQDAQMTGAQIELLELHSKRLLGSMSELNENIVRINQSMKGLVEDLHHRILALYKYDAREELNLLLSTEDAHEAITMTYMLDRLSRQDQMILEELGGKIRELEQAKASLEKNRGQLVRQTAELKEQRSRHNAAITKANALLRETQDQRRKALEAAREVEAAQREIGQKILALLDVRQKRRNDAIPAGGGPPPQGAPSLSTSPSGSSPKPRDYPDYTYLAKGSRLEWPLRGPVITLFGSRHHPVFKTKVFNSGIEIRASAGAPVKAAGPGEVLFCGWLRGFGQVVIVNHGDNLSTVYAHLGTTSVGEGDAVRLGSILGTVGNTGTKSEYSLHFEVRHGGTAKDPLSYLRRI